MYVVVSGTIVYHFFLRSERKSKKNTKISIEPRRNESINHCAHSSRASDRLVSNSMDKKWNDQLQKRLEMSCKHDDWNGIWIGTGSRCCFWFFRDYGIYRSNKSSRLKCNSKAFMQHAYTLCIVHFIN